VQQALRQQAVIENRPSLIDEGGGSEQAEKNIQDIEPDDIALVAQHDPQAAAQKTLVLSHA